MADEQTTQVTQSTTTSNPVSNGESKVLGVSIRAVVMIILTLTVCGLAVKDDNIRATVTDGFLIALGFYYGQAKPSPKP